VSGGPDSAGDSRRPAGGSRAFLRAFDEEQCRTVLAEVAWRAGRTGIAVQLLDAFLAATPDQPSHADQRQILKAIRAAAVVDAAAADGSDWAPLADEATTLANELASGHEADYATIATFVNTATAARRALKAPGRSATEGL
jgi:hypothetical protein